MSLVKKLQQGNTITQTPKWDQNWFNNEVANYHITSKGQREVLNVLGQLRNSVENGKLSANFNPDGSYELVGNDAPLFQGSSDLPKNKLTGDTVIKSREHANSVALTLYKKYLDQTPNQPLATPVKEKANIAELGNFAIQHYGTERALQSALEPLKTDAERQKLAMNLAKEHLNKYIQNAAINPNIEYSDLQEAKNVLNSVNAGKWEDFVANSAKLKWDPSMFLLSEEQKNALEQQKLAKDQEDAYLEAIRKQSEDQKNANKTVVSKITQPQAFAYNSKNLNTIYHDPNSKLSDVAPMRTYTDLNTLRGQLYNEIAKPQYHEEEPDSDVLTNMAAHLRYTLKHASNNEEQQKALELYGILNNFIKRTDVNLNSNMFYKAGQKYKDGGAILKAASGSELIKQWFNSNSDGKLKYFKKANTLKGITSSPSEIVSTAAGIASLLPGVTGLIGGGVQTVADFIHDTNEDNPDKWKNLLTNVAFTGMSGLGLGVLGKSGKLASLLKLSKFGNAVKDSEKIINIASKAEKIGASEKDIEAIKKVVPYMESKEITSLQDLTKHIADLGEDSDKAKELKDGLEALQKVKDAPNPVLGSNKLGKVVSSAADKATSGADSLTKFGLRAGSLYGVGSGIYDIGQHFASNRDFDTTDPNDWMWATKSIPTLYKWRRYKSGGIIKARSGTTLYGGNKVDLSIKPNKEGNLFYGRIDTSGTDWRFDKKGNYTPAYLSTIKGLDQNWFNQNQPKIQEAINKSGSTFKLQGLDQFKKLATDKMPGVIHDVTNQLLRTPTLNIPKANIPSSLPMKSYGTLDTNTGTGILPGIKDVISGGLKSLDTTDISNIFLYANSRAANNAAYQQQAQAAMQTYKLPSMPKQYFRVSSNIDQLGNKQATDILGKTNRIASSTSDIDKATAVNLEGIRQANDVISKSNVLASEERDKLRAQQVASDSKIDAYNTEVVGKNRAIDAQAAQRLGMLGANKTLADSTTFNNLVLALNKNAENKQYNQGLSALYKAYTDPNLINKQKQYSDLISEAEEAKRKAAYESLVKTSGAEMPAWQQSEAYKSYQNEIASKNKELTDLMEPINKIQMAIQFRQPIPISKSGGSLSKADKIEIEAEKAENTRKQKEAELAVKSMLSNNELLQKALLKVFK